MLIYPTIDLKEGRCVRLLNGRFDSATDYDSDPWGRLCIFADAGASWAHVVDLDGAKAGAPAQYGLISNLTRHPTVKIQAGGGVRSAEDVERLLDQGVSRVVIGSLAVNRPDRVRDWLGRFGAEHLCLALDGRWEAGAFRLAAKGWTEGTGIALDAALAAYPPGNLAHVLVTDIGRDGALTGANAELMAEAIRLRPELQVQASGGVASIGELRELKALGVAGAIVGRALYENRFSLEEALDAG